MILFVDANEDFQRWIAEHPDGYVIGCTRWPAAGSAMRLHRANCTHTRRMQSGASSKACAVAREELLEWAKRDVGGNLSHCPYCHP